MVRHPIELKKNVAVFGHNKIATCYPDQQITDRNNQERRYKRQLDGFVSVDGSIALPQSAIAGVRTRMGIVA